MRVAGLMVLVGLVLVAAFLAGFGLHEMTAR